jgi:hypothetical protein
MTRLFTAVFAAVLPELLTLTGGLTALTATPDRDHDRLPGRSRAPPGCDRRTVRQRSLRGESIGSRLVTSTQKSGNAPIGDSLRRSQREVLDEHLAVRFAPRHMDVTLLMGRADNRLCLGGFEPGYDPGALGSRGPLQFYVGAVLASRTGTSWRIWWAFRTAAASCGRIQPTRR